MKFKRKKYELTQVSPEDVERWKIVETSLKMLLVNSFNYTKTATETKVSYTALRSWARKYGKIVLGDAYDPNLNASSKRGHKKIIKGVTAASIETILVPQKLIEADRELFVANQHVVTEANKAMLMAINRLKILLVNANIEQTKEAIMALNEIADEPRREAAREKGSLVNFILNQLIIKDNDDNKETFISIPGR